MSQIEEYISKLKLQKHPEGGWYNEVYRSENEFSIDGSGFPNGRAYSTGIYFLLEKGQISAFHRIKSDEIWHFYDGGLLEVISIDENGKLEFHKVGLNLDAGYVPQVTIPAGRWFASRVVEGDFVLAGCTVAPGFSFEDFEMANRNDLLAQFPNFETFINELTY